MYLTKNQEVSIVMEPTNMQPANMQPANIRLHPTSFIKIDSEERKNTRYPRRARDCSTTALKRLNQSSACKKRSHPMTTRTQSRKVTSITGPQPKASKLSSMRWKKTIEDLNKILPDVQVSDKGIMTLTVKNALGLTHLFDANAIKRLFSPEEVNDVLEDPPINVSVDMLKLISLLPNDASKGTYQAGYGLTWMDPDTDLKQETPISIIYNKDSAQHYKPMHCTFD